MTDIYHSMHTRHIIVISNVKLYLPSLYDHHLEKKEFIVSVVGRYFDLMNVHNE